MLRFLAFLLGVLLPLVALAVELSTRMCGEDLLDPIPTPFHVAAVALVALANLAAWLATRSRVPAVLATPGARTWVREANAIAIGIASAYAVSFLPWTPLMAMVVFFYGLGLLGLAPLFSLLVALGLRRSLAGAGDESAPPMPRLWPRVLLAWVLLIVPDVPRVVTEFALRDLQAAERSGDLEAVAASTARLRRFGDRAALLDRCYGLSIPGPSPISALLGPMFRRHGWHDDARSAWYRVTGESFQRQPPPRRVRRVRGMADWGWDPDQGGTTVGHHLASLFLVESSLRGMLEPEAHLGYLEWTMVFRNDYPSREVEARARLLLPEDAVVSRLTLWVAGEEREAAYAGRDTVRAAYERVVTARKDPALATTSGPGLVLLQCFPVPSRGTIKVKLGVTFPLQPTAPGKARAVLPRLLERNFSIGPDLAHSVSIASPGSLSAGTFTRRTESVEGWLAALGPSGIETERWSRSPSGAVTRYEVAEGAARSLDFGSEAVVIEAEVAPGPPRARTRDGRAEPPDTVVQEIVEVPGLAPERIVVLLDASSGMGPLLPGVADRLARLADGPSVTMVVAGDRPRVALEMPAGTSGAGARLAAAVREVRAEGGADQGAALVTALAAAGEQEGSRILWIHGPQPVDLGSEDEVAARLARLTDSGRREARVVEVTLLPGGNAVRQSLGTLPLVRSAPVIGAPLDGLSALLELWDPGRTRRTLVRRRGPGEESGEAWPASAHLARLAARDRIEELARQGDEAARTQAIGIAHRYQLVTSVSGAVVLETAQQYQEAGLEPARAGEVPTVPEPATGLLVLVAGVAAWVRRRRQG